MKLFWDNTYLTRDERVRIIILLFIFFMLCFIKYYMVVFYQPVSMPVDKYTLDSVQMVSILKEEKYYTKKENTTIKEKSSSQKKPIENKRNLKEKPKAYTNFQFDPNKISKDSLLLLGFSKYAANSLMKYRSKGGIIKSIDQMSKINGLDEATLNRLIPFVELSVQSSKIYATKTKIPKTHTKKIHKRKEPKIIEINTSDTSDFMSLHGIGQVYSKRIIKFRKSLGGFFAIDQIKEVWGIEDSLFQSIKPYLTVDPSLIQKRNINKMNKESLNKHPYLDWQKSKSILSYKSAHGKYNTIDELYKLHLLEDRFVDTLKHYFVVK